MAGKGKGIHAGHRQRLKNRFITSGLDNFEPHNILELLLFYAIPQQDTNELAHRLIDHFGSLARVFDASYTELLKVPGIGPHASTLIKLIPAISRTYMTDRHIPNTIRLHYEELGEYLVAHFVGQTKETVYALFFDNGMRHIGEKQLFVGSVYSANFSMRLLIDEIITRNASTVVIAHNHPDGFPLPSSNDLDSTRHIESYLSACGVTLWEHYIVADNAYTGIVHARTLAPDKSAVRKVKLPLI